MSDETDEDRRRFREHALERMGELGQWYKAAGGYVAMLLLADRLGADCDKLAKGFEDTKNDSHKIAFDGAFEYLLDMKRRLDADIHKFEETTAKAYDWERFAALTREIIDYLPFDEELKGRLVSRLP